MSEAVKLEKAILVKNEARRFGSANEYVMVAVDQSELPPDLRQGGGRFVTLALTRNRFARCVKRAWDNPEDVRTFITEVVKAELRGGK